VGFQCGGSCCVSFTKPTGDVAVSGERERERG
jgi:hypothetical protein